MDRIVLFIAAVIPALLVLEYGVAKTRGSWTNEALWTAFMVGAVGALGGVFVEAGLTYILGFEALSGLSRAAAEAVFVAAIPEEAIKLFVLVAVAERHVDARRYQDIVVLSLSVGLGFAALENLLYLVAPGDWQHIAAVRALTSVPGHGIDGLVMGALVTLARLSRRWRNLLLALALAVPVFLHASYDFPLLLIQTGPSGSALGWAPLHWFSVLILSALVALALSNRALRKAANADRLNGRDRRPVARSVPLVWTGLVLLAAGPCVAVAWSYSANITPLWAGTITCILPVALGLDLMVTGLRRSNTIHALGTNDLPVVGS